MALQSNTPYQTYDDGVLTTCTLENTAQPGSMPVQKLVPVTTHFYGERTVGYNRQYAAMGVNEQIDLLVRVWRDSSIRIGMYVVMEDGNQYRIDNVQHLYDDDNLKVTDLTLRRLDELYDVAGET